MKTPLNYTGNKSRLLEQFSSHFPKEINVFVDLFCGGATVGLSSNAKKVIFIDNNPHVISLLKHLASFNFEETIKRVQILINKYNLTYSAKNGIEYYEKIRDNNGFKSLNSIGYYKLRDDFNALPDKFSLEACDLLYVLIMYSFNNDMRFNKMGNFNLPIGKTDLSKNNLKKLVDYTKRVKEMNCEFICGDFRDENIQKIILKADFVYADPPYLIGNAVYNESSNWDSVSEQQLISLLERLNKNKVKFAVSNILHKVGEVNEPLTKWLFNRSDLHIIDIKYHYKNASYNKLNRDSMEREVLIKNF